MYRMTYITGNGFPIRFYHLYSQADVDRIKRTDLYNHSAGVIVFEKVVD